MLINQEFNLSIPDTMRELNLEEKQEMQMMMNGESRVFSDEDRHIILSVGWKKLGGLVNLILGRMDVARHMEGAIQRAMYSYAYELKDQVERPIGGLPAKGILYAYLVMPEGEPETGMIGESLVVKKGRTIYYLHFYMRENLAEESEVIWNEILASASWT